MAEGGGQTVLGREEGVTGDSITLCDRRVEGQISKVSGRGCGCTLV